MRDGSESGPRIERCTAPAVWMSPIGISSFSCSRRPKWYAAAENVSADSGVHSRHISPTRFSTGYSETLCMARTRRIRGWRAAAISAFASPAQPTGHSILDCPEATQTSPTSTSFSTVVLMVRVNGPPASPGGRYTLQRPSESVTATRFCPRNATAHALARVSLAPDVDGQAALHHHVVGDQVRQFDLCACADGSGNGEREGARYASHL